MQYDFEWNPGKAKSNLRKHGISFERAVTVFSDPRALTIFDKTNSEDEDRWITLGMDVSGTTVIVCHTFKEMPGNQCMMRIFSARKATKKEQKQYRGK